MCFKNLISKFLISVVLIFVNNILFGSVVVLNGLTHEKTASLGETYKGVIEIQNSADVGKSVRVYQKDYFFNYKGESRHDDPGTLERSNSRWITFNPELLDLAPGEKSVIEYEVNVPNNNALKGTYWSVIMVEGIVAPDTVSPNSGVTINTAIRYAVQIVTTIGTTGSSDLQFAGLELIKEDQNSIINVVIQNTGERQLRPEVAIEIFDEEGNSVTSAKAERRKTFPGTSIQTTLEIKGIKPGKYTGVLVADCDEDHVFGTNVSFELE